MKPDAVFICSDDDIVGMINGDEDA